jgi:histidine triad (HIT) family protein
MEKCIFCQIVSGKSPSYKVYEDDLFYGFLDIFPVTKGHILLVPKKHYRWVHDVPEFGQYWETALKLKKVLDKTLKPKWVQYFTHGLISHAHIHILPRYDEVGTGFLPNGKIDPPSKEEMTAIATKIRKNL